MTTVVIALAAGLAAGVAAGLFGIGGGILFVPVLTLGLGLSQLEGEATSLLAILPTVAAGTWRQHRYGNVRWRTALVIGVAALAGVEVGIRIAEALPEDTLRRLFGALMLVVAAQLFWSATRRGNRFGELGR
ncbi:MAG: sulfite exporter TauE/SafE family protein [Thermoleophilia bacterium]|nr:sulfite exporter TauE/SafE family protein [Thermoleophilia bacterium]